MRPGSIAVSAAFALLFAVSMATAQVAPQEGQTLLEEALGIVPDNKQGDFAEYVHNLTTATTTTAAAFPGETAAVDVMPATTVLPPVVDAVTKPHLTAKKGGNKHHDGHDGHDGGNKKKKPTKAAVRAVSE